jgi:hypothetical protein
MPIPDAARRVLARRLEARRQERWPELQELKISYRTTFAYIEAVTNDGPLKLFRLRYLGSKDAWGFAVYLASKDGYEDSFLPRGSFTGAPEEALDCACGLYLDDISAWTDACPNDSRENF